MSDQRFYRSPKAFRQALTDRLKAKAKISRWTLAELQRQMAYDRLLERLYLVDRGWIVKGATALLARELSGRATIDIDIFRETASDRAEEELREAASRDINDWFRFEIGPSQDMPDGGNAVRLPVTAYVGEAQWQRFSVDVVGSDLRMTGEPEDVRPLAAIEMPDVKQHGYRAYPLVDHIADKVAATFERHGRGRQPSSRVKDLIDLVAIVTGASVRAEPQMKALQSEAQRRGIALPDRFAVPDREVWERGYAAEARRSLSPTARTLEEALAIVSPFLDPLLDGTAAGRWDPRHGEWDVDSVE